MKVSPETMLKKTNEYLKNIEKAKKSRVAVGLPTEEVGGKVYGDGMTVIAIGAIHEYGAKHIPKRSFLDMPFRVKKKELDAFLAKQFQQVFDNGKPAEKALGLVGVKAVQISQEAFVSGGYGNWAPLRPETIARKGSSNPLIDTGVLRSSLSWIVR